jgi:hypothetical protein
VRATLSETTKSRLFWGTIYALIALAVNSAFGFITNSLNLHSASAWISIALAALACILIVFDIRQGRQKRIAIHEHREPIETDDEEEQRRRERRWRFFPANFR